MRWHTQLCISFSPPFSIKYLISTFFQELAPQIRAKAVLIRNRDINMDHLGKPQQSHLLFQSIHLQAGLQEIHPFVLQAAAKRGTY